MDVAKISLSGVGNNISVANLTVGIHNKNQQDNKDLATGLNTTMKDTDKGVLLTLSEEAKGVIADETLKEDKTDNNRNFVPENMIDQYSKMLEEQRESAKNAAKATADMAKILEIARRIASGAKVPKTDEQKLMEYNFELYLSAKEAAMLNQEKEKKEYDRLFKDEEENGEGIITGENGEMKVNVSELNLANSKMEMIKATVH